MPTQAPEAYDKLLQDALRAQAVDAELRDLKEHVATLERQMHDMQRERDSMLKWGVLTLGAAVVGMGLYLWNILTTGRLK
jgi:hypothetical protein